MASACNILSTLLFITCLTAANGQGADIAFILDGSGSVGRDNYYDVFLAFIMEVAENLPISSDSYRIGVVAFGNEGVVQMDFNEARDMNALRDRFSDENMYLDQNTNTSGGIYVMRTQLMFNRDAGARDDVAKLAVLMTDGPSTFDNERTPVEARIAREAGVTMFVIGITNPGQSPLDIDEINSIASQPAEDHVAIIDDFTVARNNLETFGTEMTLFIEDLAGEIVLTTTTTRTLTTTTTRRPPTDRPVTDTPTDRPRPRTTTTTTTTTAGPQEGSWSCEFEADNGDPTMCGMRHDGRFDWLPRVGATPTRNTGASSAYRDNVYMYMEASRPRKAGDDAVLFIPKRVFDGRQCVSFAADMTGSDIGSLEVVRVAGNGDEDVLFRAQGEQTGGWFERSVETVVNAEDKGVAFRGIVGDGIMGDISLDFINVRTGSC